MNSPFISRIKNDILDQPKSKSILENIKSKYIMQIIFDNIQIKKFLELIKYNNNIQQKLNINISNYKEYSEIYTSIEIEIIPIKNMFTKIININNEEDKKYFHIYFNGSKEETNKTFIDKSENISKINIVINYQIKSLFKLFY